MKAKRYLLQHIRHTRRNQTEGFQEGFGCYNLDEKTFYVDIEIIAAESEKEAIILGRKILKNNGFKCRFCGRNPTANIEEINEDYEL